MRIVAGGASIHGWECQPERSFGQPDEGTRTEETPVHTDDFRQGIVRDVIMKRTTLNLFIDLLVGLLFLSMVATGYILRFPLPPGTNKSLSLWGLTRHSWGDVHVSVSFALLGTLVAHVCLHWQWIATVVRRQFNLASGGGNSHVRGGLFTAAGVAAVLVLFGWAAQVSVTEREEPCCPPGRRAVNPGGVPTGIGEPTGATGVSFARDVYPILEASCLSCHGLSNARGGFHLDRREDYFGAPGKPLVVAGKSAESELIAIVSGARKDLKPANRHRLPEKEVSLLRKWIDEGAQWPERIERQ